MFRRRRFLAGAEAAELRWFTPAGTRDDRRRLGRPERPWRSPSTSTDPTTPTGPTTARSLVDDDFLVLVNAWWEPLDFTVPPTRAGLTWQTEIDTYDPATTRHRGPTPRRRPNDRQPPLDHRTLRPPSRRRPARMTDPKRTLRDCKKTTTV